MLRKRELSIPSMCLLGLDNLGRRWSLELSTENDVPEAAGDTKTVVEVGKVMLEVILLELLIVRWKAA